MCRVYFNLLLFIGVCKILQFSDNNLGLGKFLDIPHGECSARKNEGITCNTSNTLMSPSFTTESKMFTESSEITPWLQIMAWIMLPLNCFSANFIDSNHCHISGVFLTVILENATLFIHIILVLSNLMIVIMIQIILFQYSNHLQA